MNTIEAIEAIGSEVKPNTINAIEEEAKKRLYDERTQTNADRESEAVKILRDSLFRLYHDNRALFVACLQFDAKNRSKKFEKEYIGVDIEDGTPVTLTASIKFTIFDLWNDVNDPSKTQRENIGKAVEAIKRLASDSPSKADRSKACEAIKTALRLLGFGEESEKVTPSDAKRILINAYYMTDNGKDDGKKNEVKRGLQSTLYRIVTNTKATNAIEEAEEKAKEKADAKKREAEEAKRILEEAKAEAKRILEEAKAKREAKEK